MSGTLLLAVLGLVQAGDRPGERQPPLPPEIERLVPPAPVVPPERAIATFRVAPGFVVETVAAEPLVVDPVALAFDPDGRLAVVEMNAFMPSLDPRGERDPVCRIVILEDRDGDGRVDTRTVFLDGLVLPRAIAAYGGGFLVAEPPNLWHCVDADGDLKCDTKTLVDGRYGVAGGNPEHLPNGLLTALDNWVYSAEASWRHRRVGGQWIRGHTRFRGQWGISQDDAGRLYTNHNTTLLRGDAVPCFAFEAHSRLSDKVNLDLSKDQTVRPIRPTTGVNRGYQADLLRPDGSIRVCVSACGPAIYRGDNFPEEYRGNAFVCEPAGNLIRRFALEERDGVVVPKDVCAPAEFLASTDERFRPVNLYTGPDGCLYVLDFYRGIIQHGAYMTSFLRGEVVKRGLERPTGLGRIYRIRHAPRLPAPALSRAAPAVLLAELGHANGWRRDTAQRLLVERADRALVPDLERLVRGGGPPRAGLHALWVLEGLGALEPGLIDAAAKAPLLAASAEALRGLRGPLLGPVDGLFADASRNAPLSDERLAGKELDLLEAFMSAEEWEAEPAGGAALLRRLAGRVLRSGVPARRDHLLKLIASQASEAVWRQKALLRGLQDEGGVPSGPGVPKLLGAEDGEVRELARAIWPDGPEPAPGAAPLVPEERVRFERGRRQYLATCAGCHLRSGLGNEGVAPSLVDSGFVQGPEGRLIRIVLHGLVGPLRAEGRTYSNAEMPAVLNLSSEETAEILTYVRRQWGHRAPAVHPDAVRAVRREHEERDLPWTQPELMKVR
jgi:glucose/arabinose dehydrogenase/mono/diheme cytochrome c family protein